MLKFAIPFAALCALMINVNTASAMDICMVSNKPSWADYCAKYAPCMLPNKKLAKMCVTWRKIR